MVGRSGGPAPVLAVLVVGALGVGLEQGIVAPALPAIERHYGASPTSGTWLLSGFLLASAIVVPLAGRIGDQFGRRRVLIWSLLLGRRRVGDLSHCTDDEPGNRRSRRAGTRGRPRAARLRARAR